MKSNKSIEMDQNTITSLLDKLNNRSLDEEDYELIKLIIATVVNVNMELVKKNISIQRLRKLFNIKTEKSTNILPEKEKVNKEKSGEKYDKKEKKGHGRMSSNCYSSAEKVFIKNESLKPGDNCPACLKGKLYNNIPDGVFVKIKASPPFQATMYIQEKLRCNLCGKIYTAEWPKDVEKVKYEAGVSAMIALLKYGSGFPFYRIGVLQGNLEVPIPPSTQWDIISEAVKNVFPVYEQLVFMAAQGEVIHNDDTNMKVLSLMKENKSRKPSERKGIFTTGIISKVEGKEIALYYTGRNHSGENITKLLQNRLHTKGAPIQMCDALSRNPPKELETILSNCLTHGRRYFVDLIDNFPLECEYVIKKLASVYHADSVAKETNMTAEERLSYHQKESGPLMAELKSWMEKQIEDKKVEPNSSLGEAIQYMLNHWEKLTLFLKVAGAPLDNNIAERALKRAILNRKNAMFYKTENGARVGDIFMGIIETCNLGKINSYKYLVALQKYANAVKENPSAWMPWNFESAYRREKRKTGQVYKPG
jgi:transposase